MNKIKYICVLFFTIDALNSLYANDEIKALWATSRYAADIKFIEVDDHSAPKWYIGPCSGDITLRANRIKIYEADHKGSDVIEVQIVDRKYYADVIYCIKD